MTVAIAAVAIVFSISTVKYILDQYTDAGVDLKPAHDCLKSKCPNAATATTTNSAEAKDQRRRRRNVRRHEI